MRNCKNQLYKCAICNGKLNISICDGNERLPQPTEKQPIRGVLVGGEAKVSHSSVPKSEEVNSGLRDFTQPVRKTSNNVMHVNTDTNGNYVLLQTAIADVSKPNDPNVWAAVRLMFDSCSQKSYITNKLHSELRLPVIGREILLVKTFGEVTPKLGTCDIVQMCEHTRDGLAVYISCYSVPEICSPISCQVIEVAKSTYPHLWGLTLADNPTSEEQREMSIDCLLGADNCWQFLEGSVVQGEFPGPVAVLSKFGWLVSGPVNVQGNDQLSINLFSTDVLKTESFVVTQDATLKEELSKFWNYETLGIKSEEPTLYEPTLYDSFADQVKFRNGRYEVSLPFKEVHEVIPDNFSKLCSEAESQIEAT